MITPWFAGAVAGLGSGTIAALVTPWAKWGVEKRRDRRRRQNELVDSWHAGLHMWAEDAGITLRVGPDELQSLRATQWYRSLRPYLTSAQRIGVEGQAASASDGSDPMRQFVPAPVIHIDVRAISNPLVDAVGDAIHDVEIRWRLVDRRRRHPSFRRRSS